ncbi:CHASE2 domain-containing protein [Leeia oryzae]|uniref:CHASE2 domain-containing protein n=1 Tax=Leeia oryzae TaxID=356662 RepID=UPI000361C66D|nr:adenylate/guanylate cyclase domain-containing protein [Leeia oryzae]
MKRFLSSHRWPISIGALLLALCLLDIAGILTLPGVQRLESMLYDVRFSQSGTQGSSADIVILDIDEKTLEEQGQWPWPRQRLARLMDTLFDQYHVRMVGFDITFADPDSHNPLPLLNDLGQHQLANNHAYQETLRKISPALDPDVQLAASFKGRPVVLGYYLSTDSRRKFGVLPAPVLPQDVISPASLANMPAFSGYGANLALLQKSAASAGHFNPIPDVDGVIRRVPLLEKYGDGLYESLSLGMYRLLNQSPPILPVSHPSAGGYATTEALLVGDYRIPVDDRLNALIPYLGSQHSFPYLSVTDVLQRKVRPQDLNRKIVLIGTSAPGLVDLRNTPVASVYPGVEIHANLLAGMIEQRIPYRPGYADGAEIMQLILIFLILLPLLILCSPLVATGVTLLVLALVIAGNYWLWNTQHIDIPLLRSLLLITILFIVQMSFGYFMEARKKRQLANRFGQYVPPEIVEKMNESPESYSTEGQNREMTVMFSDVRNFTTISEHMAPQQLTDLMNLLLTELTTVVRKKYLGTIDKYIGDCIMAFWGAPLADEQHAEHAVAAALDMQATMIGLRTRLASMGLPPMIIGVGINTGKMTVGDMGSSYRMSYTVMGDAVNLAARMESLTKLYGVSIIVGDQTYLTTRSRFLYRELDQVVVKGKETITHLYEPLCYLEDSTPELQQTVQQFSLVLMHYRAGDFASALTALQPLLTEADEHGLYRLYQQRINHYLAQPPGEGWDGTTRMDAK